MAFCNCFLLIKYDNKKVVKRLLNDDKKLHWFEKYLVFLVIIYWIGAVKMVHGGGGNILVNQLFILFLGWRCNVVLNDNICCLSVMRVAKLNLLAEVKSRHKSIKNAP